MPIQKIRVRSLATSWLREYLQANQPCRLQEVNAAAVHAGFGPAVIRSAAGDLNVISRDVLKAGSTVGRPEVQWSLPS